MLLLHNVIYHRHRLGRVYERALLYDDIANGASLILLIAASRIHVQLHVLLKRNQPPVEW